MFRVPRRQQRIAVALPATLTLEIPHLREKTARIGFIARALTIFRVDEVIIYNDQDSSRVREEAKLIEKILRFQETPQYLRKHLFKVDSELEFAGVLPPLRTPHHPDKTQPRPGFLREGVVTFSGSTSEVNAGFDKPVLVRAKLERGKRVTVQIKTAGPRLEGELIDSNGLTIYWRLTVTRDEHTLGQIINRGNRDLTISTSRQGMDIREALNRLQARWKSSRKPIILFGSPSEGVPEILSKSQADISRIDFNINMIPNQGVETVRTEEALLSSLTVLNLLEEA